MEPENPENFENPEIGRSNPENPEIGSNFTDEPRKPWNLPFLLKPWKNILDTKNPEIYPFLIGYDRLQSFYKQNISQICISFQ